MKTYRIFVDQLLTVNANLVLNEATSHRLINVLRLAKEDPLRLFNGDGCEYTSIITEVKRNAVTVTLLEKTNKDIESPLKIHLGQAIAKGEKMDFVMQKSVELGVDQISPLFSERCVVPQKAERLEKKTAHWQQIALHAAEQSGRGRVPLVAQPQSLMAWVANRTEQTRFVLDPLAEHTLATRPILGPVALLIGPEGGLSRQEIEQATLQGFQPLKFGPRILRTETAALAVIAALQCMAGDLGR